MAPTTDPVKLSIPLIDITPLTSPTFSTRQTCAKSILSAFQTHGFLYITSPPNIPSSTISNIFTHSASFFARPQSQKDSLAWTTPLANRGYVSQGREKTSHSLSVSDVAQERLAGGSDLKESMEIGRDGVPGSPNQWPDRIDAEGVLFRSTMTEFFTQCAALHRLLMSAIALGLDLSEDFFSPYLGASDNNLRLLHYPAVPRRVFRQNKHQVRAGAHTDYGSLTLLWQDARGGLQVQPDGEGGAWEDVAPVPGSVVVNAGDLMARWSNDRIRSTRHRVVEPPLPPRSGSDSGQGQGDDDEEEEDEMIPARYSIAYFCNPDFESVIDALPNTYSESEVLAADGQVDGVRKVGLGGKKFPPVKTGEYLVQRLTATY